MKQHPSLHTRALPARWRRGRFAASAASLLLVVFLFYPLSKLVHADTVDAWWLAARFTLREKLSPPPSPDPDIVLVTVDNKCIANWPEPIVAWNPHFAKAIQRI